MANTDINPNKALERSRNDYVALGSLNNSLKNLSTKEERNIIAGEANEISQGKVKANNATTLNTAENIATLSSSVKADTIDQPLNLEAQATKINVSNEEVESKETVKNIDVPASIIVEANNIIQNEEVSAKVVEANAETKEAGVSKAPAPQAQAPKAQTLRVEAPKAKTVKEVKATVVEASKAEVKEVEATFVEASKAEVKEVEATFVEASKAEVKEVEATFVEAPKAEVKEVEATVVEAPKAEVEEVKTAVVKASKAEVKEEAFNDAPIAPNLPNSLASRTFKIVKNPRSEKSKALLGDGPSARGTFLSDEEFKKKIEARKKAAEEGALEFMGSKIDETAKTEVKKAPVNAAPIKFDANGIPIAPALPVLTATKSSSIKKSAFTGNEKPVNAIDLNQLKAKIEARKAAIEVAARKEAEAKAKAEAEARTQKAIEEKARLDAEFVARKAAEAKEAAELAARKEAEAKAQRESEAKKIADATGADVNDVLAQNEAIKIERAKTAFKNFTKKVIAAKNFGGSLLDAIKNGGITLKKVPEKEKKVPENIFNTAMIERFVKNEEVNEEEFEDNWDDEVEEIIINTQLPIVPSSIKPIVAETVPEIKLEAKIEETINHVSTTNASFGGLVEILAARRLVLADNDEDEEEEIWEEEDAPLDHVAHIETGSPHDILVIGESVVEVH